MRETLASPDALPSGAIVGLSLAAFGSGMSLRVMDAMLPRLATEFHLTLGAAALVITVFAEGEFLYGPLLSWCRICTSCTRYRFRWPGRW